MNNIKTNIEQFVITQETNLLNQQLLYQKCILINQFYFPNLQHIPVNITKLTATNIYLQDISSLCLLYKLKYLDISKNLINNISSIEFLKRLQYLNISFNRIIFLDPLKNLKFLKTIITDENKIQNFTLLQSNPNFNKNWISLQNDVDLQDFQDYLGLGSTEDEARGLMNKCQQFENLVNKTNNIQVQFNHNVNRKVLTIRGNQNIQFLQFVDSALIYSLYVFECSNIYINQIPIYIKKLVANRIACTDGLEMMNNLEELSLRGNKLTELGVLTKIKTLKILDIASNQIRSLENIQQLQQLIELDASNNQIDILDPLNNMHQLQKLALSNNKISSGSSLDDLSNIIQLNLASNFLENVNFVRNMNKVIYLDISFNRINNIEAIKYLILLVDLRLEKNMINSFAVLDQLPNKQLRWYTSEQNVQTHDYSDQQKLIKKFQNDINNIKRKIENEPNIDTFGFVDAFKPAELYIAGCPNIIFENCAQIPTKIIITKCNLQEITNIYEMIQVTNLNLSFNKIKDINELTELVNLTHLNLECNDIYRINSLEQLKKLDFLNIKDNKIIFIKPIQNLSISKLYVDNNLIIDKIYENQGSPTLKDYQNFLGPNRTEEQENLLMSMLSFNSYKQKMFSKYKNEVKNVKNYGKGQIIESKTLIINDNNDLNSIEFIQQLNIDTLSIQNCPTIKFQYKFTKSKIGFLDNYPEIQLQVNNLPYNITSLSVNKCALTNLGGFELFQSVQCLDLRDNAIISVKQLQYLPNLKQIVLDNNYIQDLEYVQIKEQQVYQQREPSDENWKQYIIDINSQMTIEELKAVFAPKKAKTIDLIENSKFTKFRTQIDRLKRTLSISKEQLMDFNFVEKMPIVKLYIMQCTYVRFNKTPTNIVELTINQSKLTNIIGLEKMKQLKYLDLGNNNLISIAPLKELTNLLTVKLQNNFIHDLWILTDLPNYNIEWIQDQSVAQDIYIQEYLDEIQLQISVQEFKDNIAQSLSKSEELICKRNFYRDYPKELSNIKTKPTDQMFANQHEFGIDDICFDFGYDFGWL
ncbi:Conserved_hypothetical protein [Hexamita inflata]|uniref:Leucine rich repeat protein n=1 Tax=Hexamita inflata TaxID=28002 RepID=A0AA86R194_9EUKA|nr:Conserved hypothetical protein [Hexamita inflata]CAI9952394.1 Conserved hypothetical protein [Hexamita inflata]CAI9963963.1 Conserved hypothetical protein [Hexamita inflata]